MRTEEKPKNLLLAESEFVPTAIMKILKGRLITAMSTLGHCHFRGVSGVPTSHAVLEKYFLCHCTLSVLAEELLTVPGGWVTVVTACVLSQLAVAGLSPGESVAQKWRGQQALMLRGAVLLGSELSRRALSSSALAEVEMSEDEGKAKYNKDGVQESKGNFSSLALSNLQN